LGNESIGLVWPAVSGFIRISTNPRIFEAPLPIDLAVQHISKLFSHPLVPQLDTTKDHWKVFSLLLSEQEAAAMSLLMLISPQLPKSTTHRLQQLTRTFTAFPIT